MKNIRIKLLLIGMTLLTLTGCASSQTEEQIQNLNQQVSILEAENRSLEETIQALQTELDELIIENTTLVDSVEEMQNADYAIYSRDIDTWEVIEVGSITLERAQSIEEKLKALANELSQSQFNGLPIEVQGVQRIGGLDIATINLKDSAEIEWYSTYFQGSTGGVITSTAIEETFLQRNLTEPWLDGIKLLYNGEVRETEHITLGHVIRR